MEGLRRICNRERPVVPKDAPPKTGLALLGATIRREASELFVLNLLIAVSCIPIVTIPAAHAAGARVAMAMLEDEPIYLWRAYWRAFRDCFVRATVTGLGFVALIGGALWVAWVYAQLATRSAFYVAPFVVAVCVTLSVGMTALHAIVLIAREEVPRTGVLRHAMLATISRPLPALAGLGFVAALWLIHVLFYPVSVFMPAVASFSLGVLVASFAVLPGVDRVLTRTPCAEGSRANQMEEEVRCKT